MSRQKNARPMCDRISSLPDEIICHILSFLPTKLVFTTSILSKRWKKLWLSVPTLDFDDKHEKAKYPHFVNFVNTVMLLRDATQSIKKFRLKCCPTTLTDVNKWVNVAIQANVDHLELSLPSFINLPSSALSLRNLVVLKLRNLTVNVVSSVDFPSLKILHLNLVRFPKHGHLMELLYGCPILEDLRLNSLLSIEDYIGTEFKGLPKLIRADIFHASYIPLEGIYNVEFLRATVGMFLHCNDIPVFRHLTHLVLISTISYWDSCLLVDVLMHCPKLQILVIVFSVCKNWIIPRSVPACLSSHLRVCSFEKFGGLNCQMEFARFIMENARVLQTMTICSTNSAKTQENYIRMIQELSMCPKISAKCDLSFK